LIAGFHPQPGGLLLVVPALLVHEAGRRLAVGWNDQHIDVDADKVLGVRVAEAGGCDGAVVPALGGVALVAEDLSHQVGQAGGDGRDVEALLWPRVNDKPKPGSERAITVNAPTDRRRSGLDRSGGE
jgi:hypothetical protein